MSNGLCDEHIWMTYRYTRTHIHSTVNSILVLIMWGLLRHTPIVLSCPSSKVAEFQGFQGCMTHLLYTHTIINLSCDIMTTTDTYLPDYLIVIKVKFQNSNYDNTKYNNII